MAGHYVKLVSSGDLGKVALAFEEAIAVSFVTNPMRETTRHEIRRRFDICDRIFTTLRADLHWSVPMIVDFLPTYLKCELDGVPYEPASVRTSSWSPAAIDRAHDVPKAPGVVYIDDHGLPLSPADTASLDAAVRRGDTELEPAAFAGVHEE